MHILLFDIVRQLKVGALETHLKCLSRCVVIDRRVRPTPCACVEWPVLTVNEELGIAILFQE